MCRVWAPNAQAVAITGDFCEWDPKKYPLTKIDDAVWEGYTDEPLKEFDAYKLVITAKDGTVTYKADPYAVSYTHLIHLFYSQAADNTA